MSHPNSSRFGLYRTAATFSWWLTLTLLLLCFAPFARADVYDDMRINWFNNLTGGTTYDAADPSIASVTVSITSAANGHWSKLKAAKPFTATCFSDLTFGSDSAIVTAAFVRLNDMTEAYWAKGGSLYQSEALKADIIAALEWLNANVYNTTKASYGNWFEWQIGTPLNLNNTVVMLYDSLTPAQIANYMAAVDRFRPDTTVGGAISGANSAWAALIVGLRGVIVKDPAKTALASSTFSTLTTNVTAGDGFYNEGSNIGHGTYSFTGGYGLSLLQMLADGYFLFNPTSSNPLPPSKRSVAYNWVFNSYLPMMYQGKMPYYCIGRDISRGPSDGRGTSAAAHFAQLALGDTSASAGQVRAFAKNVFAAAGSNYVSYGNLGTMIRVKNLMTDASVAASRDVVGAAVFPVMDRATSLQNGFGAHVAYYSPRTRNYESINGENLKGWHLSDGLLYLENADWNQYNGNFWATVNSSRLPGTTVNATTVLGENKANGSTFAGGATLNRLYGAVGFILQPGNGLTLVANKSWFFFDDQVVCLGSGITSTDAALVETIVENRRLNSSGSNGLTVNGTAQSTALGWSAAPTAVRSMHLAGSVGGADIGYYFPTPATLSLLREKRTSSWSTLDASKSTASVSDNYLTAVLAHGIDPAAASYGYTLLPGMSAALVAAYAAAPTVTVLQNDANAAAVYNAKLRASGAVCWKDQSTRVSIDKVPTYLTVDKKAVVMTQTSGNQFTVSVADPTQQNTAGINVTVSSAFASLVSADAGVTVTQLIPMLKLSVATSGAKGKTFQAVFNLPTNNAALIPVASVSASADDGNVPANTLDDDFNTRWSAQGDGQWLRFDFAAAYKLSSAAVAFFGGTTRTSSFDVLTSLDGTSWTPGFNAVSNGATNGLQSFSFPGNTWAKYVRIVGHGNSQGTGWNSLTEVRFTGSSAVESYAVYAQSNFNAAQLADPAFSAPDACPVGDGVSNLLKYSQGFSPLLSAYGSGGSQPTVQPLNGYLTLTYLRLKNTTDLVYTPEFTDDLVNWRSGATYMTEVSAADVDATKQQVVVRSLFPVSSKARQAMRLRVELRTGDN